MTTSQHLFITAMLMDYFECNFTDAFEFTDIVEQVING